VLRRYPDGTRLLCGFTGDQPGIFSLRASDGRDPVRLTTYPFGPPCNASDVAQDVAPDGETVRVPAYRREVFHQTFRAEQVALFVEKIDGTGLRQLTPYGLAFPHELTSAKWSPDGINIISTMHDGRLFAVRPDGDGLTQINLQTGTQQYFAFEPRWSPDGTRIQWPGGYLHREGRTVAGSDLGSYRQWLHCSFAYSVLACFRMRMSGSASFQRVRKSL